MTTTSEHVRRAGERDLDWLAEHDRHIAPEELRRAVENDRVYLSVRGDSIDGWLRYNLFWDNTPFLNLLFVLENERGRGAGTRLLSRWETDQLAAGYRLALTSTLSSERAQHFYRARGYRDAGALLLPGEPMEIILMKRLPPS